MSVEETPSSYRAIGSNTCLAFKTISDYEKAVTQPTAASETALANLIRSFSTFTSYTTTFPNDTLFNDPTVTNLLNGAGVIQIGAYYFKIDPVLNKVFVLPLTDAAYYSDLVSGYPQSGKVVMFSTDDDVLALINAGAMNNLVTVSLNVNEDGQISNMRGLLKNIIVKVVKFVTTTVTNATNFISETLGTSCGDGFAGRHHYTILIPSSLGDITLGVRYRSYGIHTHLYAEMSKKKNTDQTTGIAEADDLEFSFYSGMESSTNTAATGRIGYVYYKQKCISTITEYATLHDKGKYELLQRKRIYHGYRGSKALNKYYFGASIIQAGTGYTPVKGVALIRSNM